jgi:CysZ protein
MTLRLNSFLYGLTLPILAFKKIISQPKLVFWSLLPIGITLGFYHLFVSEMQNQMRALVGRSMAIWGMDPQGWLAFFLLLLSKLLLLFVSALTFSFVATIVACPFNDFLAEQSESCAVPPLSKVGRRTLSEKLRLLGLDLLRSLLATGVNLVALLFSWVPFLNFLALLITFLVISFQFTSYPQTRRGLGMAEGVAFLWRHTYACLGFGAVFTLLFTFPILSSVCLPLAVVGGTLLVARAQSKELQGERSRIV